MDNILELDDVLPDLASMTMNPMGTVGSVVKPDAPAGVVFYNPQPGMVIPQSVIDEIANRVSTQLSAQLSDLLSDQLSERLSGDIARRIAPEVVEMVRRRLLAEPAPFRDPENLLDID